MSGQSYNPHNVKTGNWEIAPVKEAQRNCTYCRARPIVTHLRSILGRGSMRARIAHRHYCAVCTKHLPTELQDVEDREAP